MNLKKLSLFLMIFILAACGGKGTKVTKANLVILGGIASGIPGMTGGTKLYGYNNTTGETLNLTFTGQGALEVNNGEWDFAAITWDGTTVNGTGQVLEGNTLCGTSNTMGLFGGEVAINLTLSNAGCNDEFFGEPETKEANGVPKIFRPLKCVDKKQVQYDDATCTPSVAESFQVQLPDGPFGGPGLTTRCIDADSPTGVTEMVDANGELRIPIISWFDNSFPIRVRLFDGAGCSGTSQDLEIINAYAGQSQPYAAKLQSGTLQGDGNPNDVRIDNDPCLHGEGNAPAPYLSGGDYLICNEDQFAGPSGIESNLSADYHLRNDLDFTIASPFSESLVSGTFTGQLRGNGHTISNVTIVGGYGQPLGIFSSIVGDSASTEVENLNLLNISIDATDTGGVGALAGNIYPDTLITRVQAENIDIDLTRTAGSYQGVGGLIGIGNTATSPTAIQVFAIKLTNVSITVDDQYSNIGGIIGQMDDSNYLRIANINDIRIQSKSFTDTGVRVGGAVGYAFDNDSELYGVVVENLSIGDSTTDFSDNFDKVGGLVGEARTVRVVDSKVSGEIYSAGSQVGGVVGLAVTDGAGSLFDGNVSVVDIYQYSGTNIGGFAGEINNITATTFDFNNNRSFGLIDCASDCGGFVGKIMVNNASAFVNINNSYSKSDVTSPNSTTFAHIGGFAGFANSPSGSLSIIESFAEADVSVPSGGKVGGFIGRSDYASITDSFYRGTLTPGGQADNGGLIGNSIGTNIVRSFSSGVLPAGKECIGSAVTGSLADVYYESTSASDGDCPGGTGGDLTSLQIVDITNLPGYTSGTIAWDDIDSTTPIELSYGVKLEGIGETFTGNFFDPIILSTANQWNAIGDTPEYMKKTFKLGADISFGGSNCGAGFEPIGSSTNPFIGSFRGNDHIISDINCSEASGSESLGLFRNISFNATHGAGQVEDFDIFDQTSGNSLYIDNVSFTTNANNVGTLVGTVTDSGTASSPHDHRMAFKAYKVHVTNGYIEQAGAFKAGGLIGQMNLTNENSHVVRSDFEGTVTRSGNATGVGGLFGAIGGGPLSAGHTRKLDFAVLQFQGQVNGTSGTAGGVIGELNHEHMEMAYAGATLDSVISSTSRAGGFVGSHLNGIIRTSFAKGDVTCTASFCSAGGFAGVIDANATTPKSYENYAQSASVSSSGGSDKAGCYAGSFATTPTVYNSYANCDSVTGTTNSYFGSGTITRVDSGTQARSLYAAGADEGLPDAEVIGYEDLYNPSVVATYELVLYDPWIHLPGDVPRLFWETNPEVLDEQEEF